MFLLFRRVALLALAILASPLAFAAWGAALQHGVAPAAEQALVEKK
jgi:hypothetical protein